jgi:hypothetical protein
MSYKSSNFKAHPPSDSNDKYKAKAKQLQELFPGWSYDGKTSHSAPREKNHKRRVVLTVPPIQIYRLS